MANMIKRSIEYRLISIHYGDRVAKRSQVPLMNHINEGLIVLNRISATDAAKKAFCLHPLVQADVDLKEHLPRFGYDANPYVLALAMEYRSVANEYLSHRKINSIDEIRLSPLFEVNDMLVADKVQNLKDFMTYHYGKHPRSEELFEYFQNWMDRLDIPDITYRNLCKEIDSERRTS